MQSATIVLFDSKPRVQLDKMAEQIDRPRAGIIEEAVAKYLEREACYLAKTQEGIDDMEAGREIKHEEMGTRLRARGADVQAFAPPVRPN